ncbi:hypothetical protein VTN77DRAFT_5439 [Rasamsonia byssochlamydoides]|uniref:uncharacterized protein n=1 Tax=Rasamsonia byssochlamydoides TaxID=89139 RepID=UPI003743AF2C
MESTNQPVDFPCLRCHLSFSSVASRRQHIEDSLDHNLCLLCGFQKDFNSFSALQDHLERDHLYCEPCHWFAPSVRGLEQHNVSRHMMCSVCKEFFMSLNELNGHALIHRPKSAACVLCEKEFPVLSAAFNHLESGNCEGGATKADIRGLAEEFLSRRRYPRPSDGHIFRCWTCQRSYHRLSDLLQHVETRSCREGYWKGAGGTGVLVQFIRDNLKKAVTTRLSLCDKKVAAGHQPMSASGGVMNGNF